MPQRELNTGVIFTNQSCIACHKCLAGCTAFGANVVMRDETTGEYGVLVDQTKCILCGNCIKACSHKARNYRDDTDAFFEALANGENISVLVSPTLLTDYEKQYHHILGYFKHLGVRHIYNTGFGADVMVWACMSLIHEFGLAGVISQSCPVIVNYLEKYRTELLKYLMPVQSAMMCTAIYASDYLSNSDKLAYISPCIAAKYEIDDVNTYGKVSYNVTFERLMKHLDEIDLADYYAEDELSYGLGALISTTGGLSENIKQYIGFKEVLIQTSGPVNIFPYFDHYYYKEVNENGELPFLVDALSCTDGCNFGTGTNCGYEMRNETSFSAHRAKERAFDSGNVFAALDYKNRLEMMNERFRDFELSSFVRQYDYTRQVKTEKLSEEAYEDIFSSMYKYTLEQRHTDCGTCGYKTCQDMAYAIGIRLNNKENCINYSKECIRRETEKTNHLLGEISKMNEELKKSTQLKSNFLANMSHEIRTPMNAIIGMAEMALRGDLPSEEQGYIRQIKASGRSLLAIINDILDFSKIESGKMELVETEYMVMSIINDTVNIVATRIGEKNIALLVDADPDVPFKLYGDDIRIKQVLVNFANNAIKFTEQGFVELRLAHERKEDQVFLTLEIKDSGIGIKPEDQERLFTSFQQVDSKRNRNIEGTGLGLAISREFVSLMNGRISVQSAYGKGSTFSLCIPQKIVDDRPSVTVKSPETIRTVSLFGNVYVKESFHRAIGQLQVNTTDCFSEKELEAAMQAGASHAFIGHSFWNERTDALARTYPQVQVAVVVDPSKDIVNADYVRKLNQPIYSLNVAAVLNNEAASYLENQEHTQSARFEAPDAKILIVDDNAINLRVAEGLLSPMKMNITVAASAREAFRYLETPEYDVVFMDHMMPDIDGVEATHMIREMQGEYYQRLPIIALTANAINNAKEMFLAQGMNDFVAKPIEMIDITAKLRKWIPPEKIHHLGAQDPTAPAPKQTLVIQGLDAAAGLALSGTEALYREVLADYYAVIEKKAALIETYRQEKNLAAYTIEIHALKSASRLIGANKLSEMAAYLEKCGHDGDWEPIEQQTEALLDQYRALLPILQPFSRQNTVEANVDVSQAELSDKLTAMYDALEDFDLDAAKDLMEELSAYAIREAEVPLRDALIEAVDEMEYEQASEIASRWKAMLQDKVE